MKTVLSNTLKTILKSYPRINQPSNFSIIKNLIILAFFVGCESRNKLEVSKIAEFEFETNKQNNSRLALSNDNILIQSNSYFHSENKIADSTVYLLSKGRLSKKTESFNILKKKHNLKEVNIDSFFVRFVKLKMPKILTRKNEIEFRIVQNKNSEFVDIQKRNQHFKVDFQYENDFSQIFLYDIDGDNIEELFVINGEYGYWDKDVNVVIYRVD